jgi:hypothetical protein
MKGNIKIDDELRMSKLLKKFNSLFPYLKIQIFRKGEDFTKDPRDFKIFELATIGQPTGFVIDGDFKVEDVEKMFMVNLGLKVNIYRKMGKSLVETSYTSSWTLNHQNLKGQEIFRSI